MTKLDSLSDIFNNKIFRIPDYQRGYSWESSQLEDFWNDLILLDNNKIHYTGLLTIKKSNDVYQLVDGQQRVTTSMILIKSILEKFSGEWIADSEKSDEVKKYLYRRSGKNGSIINVIFGYESDNPSNCHYISKVLKVPNQTDCTPSPESIYTHNLDRAVKFFNKRLKDLNDEDLESLYIKLTKSFKFNFYELSNELDEFITFETMNNRGKPLSTLELLKNRLIYLTTLLTDSDEEKNALRSDINNSWKTTYEYLGKNRDKIIDDDTFLKDHWIIYFDYDRSIANPEKKFLLKDHFTSKKVNNKEIGYNDISSYVKDIQQSAIEYFYLQNPEHSESPYNDEVKKWISKLNRLGFSGLLPIFLAVAMYCRDSDRGYSHLLELSKKLENFIFLVYFITNRRSDTGKGRLYKSINSFYRDHKDIEKLFEEIDNERFIDENNYNWADIDIFIKLLKDKDNYWYDWKGTSYLLYEYELYLKEKSRGELKLNWENINKESIEHIYPQNPKECWKKSIPKKSNKTLHTVGNLILVSKSKNSHLSNRCFNEKKKILSIDSYSSIEVSKEDDWTRETIFKRTENILDFISSRWNIEITDNQKNSLI